MLVSALRPALAIFACLTLLTGVAYPLLVTGISAALFPVQAHGSLIFSEASRAARPVGSALIGQNFTEPKYFWGRPSGTGTVPYNPLASGGTNQGPLNPALLEAVKARIDLLRSVDPGNAAPVPVDLVTASASGLDPHISIAAAQYQLARVARARHMDVGSLQGILHEHMREPWLGWFGEPCVNVLELNLALDGIAP